MINILDVSDQETRSITLKVNGQKCVARVSSRDVLADVIREKFRLTGTHIGCDQGVCGACTILIDGTPQRSCIAFAVDCENVEITTIEGFNDDPTMQSMRAGFRDNHALQCGFCTSGMLITARDMVLRLGEIQEPQIRMELAGNLCRCTGYTGIVDAIRAVGLGKEPTGSAGPATLSEPEIVQAGVLTEQQPLRQPQSETKPHGNSDDFPNAILQSVKVDLSPDDAWAVMRDLRTAASCIPGAEVVSLDHHEVTGKMHMALGPIRAQFTGSGTYEIDDDNRQGLMTAGGRDALTGSTVTGRITWTVKTDGSTGSIIDVGLAWKLTGALAQFGRGGIVTETVRRLAIMFGENLEQLLREGTLGDNQNLPVGLKSLIWPVIKSWFAGLFKRNDSK
ncbi:2Fe-2S iron-sulfur cluster-binding protein [Pseudomonas sp. JY-Q]|uniref:2Fe-2S iron-sulfur cluster-binding protein n=1 Tax=Pseudomonas sp. JY-Q TaxID=1338689 RepID=UPI0009ED2E68|nr:2Fe-2S iron-sulfur cluster-binding protein [Pseudomonas sp. JY-Q]